MKKKPLVIPIALPSRGPLRHLVRALYSISNFVKSSVISLLVIVVILVLLSQMDQAYTMLIHMLEVDRFSLLLCYLMLNILALSLSHYPIYLYYAGNLNGSRKHIVWEKSHPFSKVPLKWIGVYIFRFRSISRYTKDIYSNILRNCLGLFLFSVWIHFLVSTFSPLLSYPVDHRFIFKIIVYVVSFVPYIIYFRVKRKLSPQHSSSSERKRIYAWLGRWYVLFILLSLGSMFMVLFYKDMFSFGGMIILFIATLSLMFHFLFFRLVRPRMMHVFLNMSRRSKPITIFVLSSVKLFGRRENYLVTFQLAFYGCLLAIVYFNLASIYSLPLPNGISIVLIYLYFFYFALSSIFKFYFVYFSIAKTESIQGTSSILNSLAFKTVTLGITLFSILFFMSFFTESSINELEKVPIVPTENPVHLSSFNDSLDTSPDTLFFVSSHGGGLKANVWTLHVLNELNKESNGQFLDRTVAMSGASGGSLGLALFGDIVGTSRNNQQRIDEIIQQLEGENFASVDISMLMGLDAFRTLFPFNQIQNIKDRSYYDMLKYQNIIHNTHDASLLRDGYRSYWNKLQKKAGKLPMLIMNTASTSGRRGIFWTIKSDRFNDIFPYAVNLAELPQKNGETMTIPFYQALSTTNRFPIFSPVAKIKGSGHYMDAGAIDNSGILGCLDVFLYYDQQGNFDNKQVVFVDIINSKSLYTDHLLASFIETKSDPNIPIDENEKLSLAANIQTGLNIDKIPRYLSDFMKKYTKTKKSVSYRQIFLPHKVLIEDIEATLDATIDEGECRDALIEFLEINNYNLTYELVKDNGKYNPWQYYDPVLCRQLSKSNIRYFSKIKKSYMTGIPEVLKFIP